MSVLIVDTSCWVAYFKGEGIPAIDDALRHGTLHLPPIVAAELMSARLAPTKRHALADFLQDLPLIETRLDHWFRVGNLRLQASAKGLNISSPDAHIAQCCLDLRAHLLSYEKIFRKLKDAVCPELIV